MKETTDQRPRTVVQRTYEIEIPYNTETPAADVVDRVTMNPVTIEIVIAQEDQDPPTMFMNAGARVEQMIRSRKTWDAFKTEVDAVWKAWDTDRSTVTTETR